MASRSLLLLLSVVAAVSAVTQPPGIFQQADQNIYYKARETVQMICEATGIPRPKYTWQRNGIDFNPSGNDDRMVQLANVGTIVINRPEDKDEGMYQCFADNGYGKSASIIFNLREAKLMDFPTETDRYYRPNLGDSLTLECVAPESIPPPEVYWAIKETNGGFSPINYDMRISMDHESRLRFVNVQSGDKQDGKAYVCMAMNAIMRRNTQGRRHFVDPQGVTALQQQVRYLWASPSDHFGLYGQRFRVKCIFQGNPTPDVHWERVDGAMPEGVKFRSFGQEMVIENLKFEDAGQYECWATNIITPQRVSQSMKIRVQAAPYWVKEPKDVELGVGQTADFHCLAYAIPSPEIYWFINGVPLPKVTDPRITGDRFIMLREDLVRFSNVNKEDAMVIQCNITNKHGYVFGDVYLNVLSEAPTIMVPPEENEVVAEGQSVNLTCRTTGKPDPQITWFKSDRQITGGRYRTLLNGDLSIDKVVMADAGRYLCMAQNLHGEDSSEGRLLVRRKTRIEQKPQDLQVFALNDAKFTCSATTDPEEVQNLRIRWLKDDKEITSNDQRMTTNNQDNSLTISGTIVRDSGTYTCVADNGLDNETASAMLTVKDRPDAPENVKVEKCDQATLNATISWTTGTFNFAPIQYFIVQFNTSYAQDNWIFGTKVDSTQNVAIVKMSPNSTYSFRVVAYNKIGESDPSQATSNQLCQTKPAVPDHHPENVRTIGSERFKLYIEWTPMSPLQQNGPGFQYILQFRRSDQPDFRDTMITIDNWETNYYLYDTPNEIYQLYYITLKAKNGMGEARQDVKTINGYTGEGVPDASTTPTDIEVGIINDTSATLRWTFNRDVISQVPTTLRGEFKGFKVQFWQERYRDQTLREWDVSPGDALKHSVGNIFTATIQDLLPYTDMEARISVMNNFYVGRPSDIIKFRTQAGVPGPVESFRARSIGDNHFNLEWQEPLDKNGIVVGYDIGYQTVSGLDLGKMQDREPQINDPYQTSAILSGLMPSTRYRVYIWARTALGRGDPYFAEMTTTAPGMPEAPRFTIANIGENYINVTWWVNPYARSGTVVFVEYRKEGATEWLQSTDEVVNMWKNVTDLEAGTVYDIRVVATNSKVRSESHIEKVRTLGVAAAVALIGNIGWFIGMILALLFIIALIVLIYICFKRGFRFSDKDTAPISRKTGEPRGCSNDYYDDEDRDSYLENDKKPPSYHSDDYGKRDSRDYEDYDRDDFDKCDAGDYDRDYDRDDDRDYDDRDYDRDYDRDQKRHSGADSDHDDKNAYEDYDRKPADFDNVHCEPDKFDRSGTPVSFEDPKGGDSSSKAASTFV